MLNIINYKNCKIESVLKMLLRIKFMKYKSNRKSLLKDLNKIEGYITKDCLKPLITHKLITIWIASPSGACFVTYTYKF